MGPPENWRWAAGCSGSLIFLNVPAVPGGRGFQAPPQSRPGEPAGPPQPPRRGCHDNGAPPPPLHARRELTGSEEAAAGAPPPSRGQHLPRQVDQRQVGIERARDEVRLGERVAGHHHRGDGPTPSPAARRAEGRVPASLRSEESRRTRGMLGFVVRRTLLAQGRGGKARTGELQLPAAPIAGKPFHKLPADQGGVGLGGRARKISLWRGAIWVVAELGCEIRGREVEVRLDLTSRRAVCPALATELRPLLQGLEPKAPSTHWMLRL